ncbi:MAG: hypothetical protein V3U26_05310 [Dehalococcoidia bacterium]
MWFTTQTEEQEVAQEQVDTLFATLEDWFQAIENGTAHHRLPDPSFEPPPGRPAITEVLVEEFIKELDREINTDAFGSQGRKYGADASSEFHRLDYPQRVALVQQLMGVLLSEKEMAQKAEELRAQRSAQPDPSGDEG